MKRLFSVFLAVIAFCACAPRYTEEDFLGRTSAEIIAQYGEFDCISMPAGEDGLYRGSRCGYTIKEPVTGWLGTSPEVLFFIIFDQDGIAVSCEEGTRPGG
ncbi:MAG: hypothetical protein IJC25_05750 [Clostridia bacterium]|nr:hypothetical protein [Clostridia bacterium]